MLERQSRPAQDFIENRAKVLRSRGSAPGGVWGSAPTLLCYVGLWFGVPDITHPAAPIPRSGFVLGSNPAAGANWLGYRRFGLEPAVLRRATPRLTGSPEQENLARDLSRPRGRGASHSSAPPGSGTALSSAAKCGDVTTITPRRAAPAPRRRTRTPHRRRVSPPRIAARTTAAQRERTPCHQSGTPGRSPRLAERLPPASGPP